MTNNDDNLNKGVLNTERKIDNKKKLPKISDLDKEVEDIVGKPKNAQPKLELAG